MHTAIEWAVYLEKHKFFGQDKRYLAYMIQWLIVLEITFRNKAIQTDVFHYPAQDMREYLEERIRKYNETKATVPLRIRHHLASFEHPDRIPDLLDLVLQIAEGKSNLPKEEATVFWEIGLLPGRPGCL